MNNFDQVEWVPPPPPVINRRTGSRRALTAGVIGLGVAAAAVLAFNLNLQTATSSNSADTVAARQTTLVAPLAERPGSHGPDLSGTVTGVDTAKSTVTIKSGSATTTYAVSGNSDIDKNGDATLADLKVGDAVTFNAVTISGKVTIAILPSGDETKNRPAGGFGMRGPHRLDLGGTVTAVDPAKSTVTIKSGSATTTYAVDSNSDIDKNGEATLADLKVGDAVAFNAVTISGKATIAILHSGDETKNRPAGGFGHGSGMRVPADSENG